MQYFRVKDFLGHTHYKSGKNAWGPPKWIKLHRALLDDPDFSLLPDSAKFHLIGILLLASQTDNKCVMDPAWIASRIGAADTVNLSLFKPWIQILGRRPRSIRSDQIRLDQIRGTTPAEQPAGFSPTKHAFESWENRHGRKPKWTKPEYVALAGIKIPEDDFKAAWDRYLKTNDRFFAGHPPRKFAADLERFREPGGGNGNRPSNQLPVGHTPNMGDRKPDLVYDNTEELNRGSRKV